jgi:hypothetical protein
MSLEVAGKLEAFRKSRRETSSGCRRGQEIWTAQGKPLSMPSCER